MSVSILIGGNIGCGKSTLLRLLEKRFNFSVFLEPVDKWQNYHGYNALNEYYSNPHVNSFQLIAGQKIFGHDELASKKRCSILERSLFSSRDVFTKIRVIFHVLFSKIIVITIVSQFVQKKYVSSVSLLAV